MSFKCLLKCQLIEVSNFISNVKSHSKVHKISFLMKAFKMSIEMSLVAHSATNAVCGWFFGLLIWKVKVSGVHIH